MAALIQFEFGVYSHFAWLVKRVFHSVYLLLGYSPAKSGCETYPFIDSGVKQRKSPPWKMEIDFAPQPSLYELRLDGLRAVAFKAGGRIHLRSRNDKAFNARYPDIVQALAAIPDQTVIDGEIVALDSTGRPSCNALQIQNYETATLIYYVFDVMILAGKGGMNEPLSARR